MLNVDKLCYAVNGSALVCDIHLEVQRGEFLALVGPNGAGKSTLLKLLSHDLHPTDGSVTLNGRNLRKYRAHELALQRAVMAQNIQVSFQFTVEEVVMMGRHPHIRFGSGESRKDAEIVTWAMEATETKHLKHRFYPTLSSGEQARVTLARVLAQDTPLLLLDEPTAALDLRHQQLVMGLLKNGAAQGKTVISIIHDLNLAAAYADKIGIVHQGRLVQLGTPAAVLREDILEQVFALPVKVVNHPVHEGKLILPLSL
ncbi:MAG: heme ABC transporter ATP-binding protein [Anaerolineae bacterium]|nr:heme ABC transporter ATP-binding protein [Anaerolineae bacterium]